MERRKLSDEEVAAGLGKLSGWTAENDRLLKEFKFADFASALLFVNKVGAAADKLDHHPDIRFGWGYAEIATTTHDRGGVTAFDLALAAEVDAVP